MINHPWPNTHAFVLSTAARDILQGNEVLISIFIIVAMSFVPASFALFVVYERYTRSSHLQLLSGVHPMTYLFANYIWDVVKTQSNFTSNCTFVSKPSKIF